MDGGGIFSNRSQLPEAKSFTSRAFVDVLDLVCVCAVLF